MRNYVQRGENLTLPAPIDVASGDGVLVGAIFGVAAIDAVQGAPCDLVMTGVFTLPKVSAQAIAIGDPVSWDNATRLVTKTAGGNTRIGAAVEGAANPSGSVVVRLNGSF